jgi:hypothetical protein
MANIPVQLPAPPQDPIVVLPNAPAFPPTSNDIVSANQYLKDVTSSRGTSLLLLIEFSSNSQISSDLRPAGHKCSTEDFAASAKYNHNILHQAVTAEAPLR